VCPETLLIKEKAMAVIKLVTKDDLLQQITSYGRSNITVLKLEKMQ
jgi:hypothetical protein